MKLLRTVALIAQIAIAALVALELMGAIYFSHWTLNGVDVSDRLTDQSFVTRNASLFREVHTIDFNGLIYTFSGKTSHILPSFTWETSIGGFSGVYLLLQLALFVSVFLFVRFVVKQLARMSSRAQRDAA